MGVHNNRELAQQQRPVWKLRELQCACVGSRRVGCESAATHLPMHTNTNTHLPSFPSHSPPLLAHGFAVDAAFHLRPLLEHVERSVRQPAPKVLDCLSKLQHAAERERESVCVCVCEVMSTGEKVQG